MYADKRASAKATREANKNAVRKAIRNSNSSRVTIIPATEKEDFYTDTSPRDTAVYARVSTDSEKQTYSFEWQQKYYTDFVERHEGWTLSRIYADEGISGTSLKKRDAFNEMIADCRQGKINLIVTKTVSRFARNIVDCISCVRELAALKPPVGVFFETEGIYTLNPNSEMSLSFLATLAQEESRTRSTLTKKRFEMNCTNGKYLTPPLLGYDYDYDAKRDRFNLIINSDEANTVRLIFYMYLSGYSTADIAKKLSSDKYCQGGNGKNRKV